MQYLYDNSLLSSQIVLKTRDYLTISSTPRYPTFQQWQPEQPTSGFALNSPTLLEPDPNLPPAHSRICCNPSQPPSIHSRPPFRKQHPRMALHPYRSPKYSLLERPILGHPPVPTHLSFCSTLDTHAHALRPLSAFNTPLPIDFRFPPKVFQPRLGSLDDTDRIDVLHDKR